MGTITLLRIDEWTLGWQHSAPNLAPRARAIGLCGRRCLSLVRVSLNGLFPVVLVAVTVAMAVR